MANKTKRTMQEDGGKWLRKSHGTRITNLLRLSGEPPKNLCIDELNLTRCSRYAQTLLENGRISRYLAKHHPKELRQLNRMLADFERESKL